MCAIEIVRDNDADSHAELTKAHCGRGRESWRDPPDLRRARVIRFLPPLTIGEELLGEALTILGAIIRDLAGSVRTAS